MSSAPDTTGASATVYDFICLFTHDLKRKQKRWQDGKLKYHTFNRKLMVYDDRGNFVGESHWQEDGDLEDGCELALERGGAIVQVAECVGSRTQDLTELVEKRAKEVEMRRASKIMRAGSGAVSTPSSSRPIPMMHAQHNHQKSLSSLVRSPGPIGRAVIPSVSPYESRVADRGVYKLAQGATSTSKRKRSVSPPSKMGHARALFGTQLSLSATPLSLSQARRAVLSQKTANIAPIPAGIPDSDAKSRDEDEFTGSSQPTPPECNLISAAPTAKQSKHPSRNIAIEHIVIQESPSPELRVLSPVAKSTAKGKTEAKAQQIKSFETKMAGTTTTEKPSELNNHTKRQQSPSLGSTNARKRIHQDGDEREMLTANPAVPRPQDDGQSKDGLPPDLPRNAPSSLRLPSKNTSDVRPHKLRGPIDVTRPQRETAKATAHTEASTVEEENGPLLSRSANYGHRADEPRTELRIRSRQRRGLLMVSEKKADRLTKLHDDIGTARTDTIIDSQKKSKSAQYAQTSRPQSPPPKDLYDLSASEDEAPQRQADATGSKSRRKEPDIAERDERFEEWLGREALLEAEFSGAEQVRPARKRRATLSKSKASDRQQVMDEHHEAEHGDLCSEKQAPEHQAAQGPRIARLARKSIKSREIIGFVPAEGVDFQMPFANKGLMSIVPSRLGSASETKPAASREQPAANETQLLVSGQERPQSPVGRCLPVVKEMSPAEVIQPSADSTYPNEERVDDSIGTGFTSVSAAHATMDPRTQLAQQISEQRNSIMADNLTSEALPHTKQSPAEAHGRLPEPSTAPATIAKHDSVEAGNAEIASPPQASKTLVHAENTEVTSAWAENDQSGVCSEVTGDGTTDKSIPRQLHPRSGGSEDKTNQSIVATDARDETVVVEKLQQRALNNSLGAPTGLEASASMAEDNIKTPKSCPCACSTSTGHASSSDSSAASTSKVQAANIPRQISNPATRGRKAAAKKDAAGMAPRTLVQLDPPRPVLLRRAPAAASVVRPDAVVQNSAVSGFTTANGGAWSKHAQDLLGMTRPGNAAAV